MSDKLNELLSKITPENRHEEIPFSSALNKGAERYSGALERLAEITDVKVKRLHPDAVMPRKAHASDAGFDLVAVEDTIIEPGETALIKTGLAFELPPGYEMQIRPRSGISLRTKLRVQLGTVDAGYTGEVGVIVDNIHLRRWAEILYGIDGKPIHDKHVNYPNTTGSYLIRAGDRICQAIIQRLPDVELIEVEELGESERGEGGFGSSGTTTKGSD